MSGPEARIGVLSDTHGKLDDQVLELFAGVDLIVHAGDIGSARILHELQAVAPVIAVEGNMDSFYPDWPLPPSARREIAGVTLYVVHDFRPSDTPPSAASVIIAGHTHIPEVRILSGGALLVNPGSVSRPSGGADTGSVALLEVGSGRPQAKIVTL